MIKSVYTLDMIYGDPKHQLLPKDVQGMTEWTKLTTCKISDSQKHVYVMLCHVTTDKCKALADIIAEYNSYYYYHTVYCNCQHFIDDALKALGVRNPIVIDCPSGLVHADEYLHTLEKGLLTF